MRIMAMVLFVLGMTALSSCSKSKEDLIVGKWELETISATYDNQVYEMDVEDVAAIFNLTNVEKFILEFNAKGEVIYSGMKDTYTIAGDKLTIKHGDESIEMNIKELTSKELSLEAKAAEDGLDVILNFKKV